MQRSLKVCCHPGCHALTREWFCQQHKQVKEYNRESPSKRGYNAAWQKARKAFLAEHLTCQCEQCRLSLEPLVANIVDHIIPHKGDMNLFWDKNNWQAMNKRCHDKKTAREDGGFGNTPRMKKV